MRVVKMALTPRLLEQELVSDDLAGMLRQHLQQPYRERQPRSVEGDAAGRRSRSAAVRFSTVGSLSPEAAAI